MTPTVRMLTLVATVGALALPGTPAGAACSSGYPVNDKRLGNHTCTGLHPGALLTVPSKKWGERQCVAGFLFTDQFGNRYTSVPGSCHLDYDCLEDVVQNELPPPLNAIVGLPLPTCTMPTDSEEEPVYRSNGPVVRDRDGDRVGAIVYAVNKNGVDFALIRIDAGVKADPAVPVYGGPTRLLAPSGSPEEAYAYADAGDGIKPNARTGILHGTGGMYHEAPFMLSAVDGTPVVKPDGSGMGYYDGPWTIGLGYWVQPYGPALERALVRPKLRLKLMQAAVK